MEQANQQPKILTKKKLILILAVLSIAYFGLLVFPNLKGTANEDMIAVFEVDEYAQYPHALQLLNPGDNLKQSLRNFLVYDHYFYGYPFYFFSGLALIPFKLIAGSEWQAQTPLIMLILRQMVNVLPNILSVWLLTYTATRFKNHWKTLALFGLLLASPALFGNSLWWHPDGIGLLFVSLVMCLLRLDDLRFGVFFALSAAAVGVAFGVKYMGAFFVLLIPAYLIIGLSLKKINWKKALFLAALFVGIMLITVILSNPLLLLQERGAMIENQRLQFSQTSQGILMGKQAFLVDGWLPQWFTQNYGGWPFLVLLLIALVLGILHKESRVQSILLLLWVLPYSIVVLNASSQRPHYWLPILLPFMTGLLVLLPDELPRKKIWQPKQLWQTMILLILAVQFCLFVVTNAHTWQKAYSKEQNAASIQFYHKIQEDLIDTHSVNGKTLIYRDWHVYYPTDANNEVFMDWNLGTTELINTRQPDYLLLERANVLTYGAQDYLDTAPDPKRLQPLHDFYRGALLDQIENYTMIYEDDFGMVFSRIEK